MLARCAFLALFIFLLAGCGQPQAFAWQSIHTTVDMQADGSLLVSEKLVLRYTQGVFTTFDRDLPYANVDLIDEIEASTDDQAMYLNGDGRPYTFTVKHAKGVARVHLIFPPTSNTTRTFTLRYTVQGAVYREYDLEERGSGTHQQLHWAVAFAGRESVVERASGEVRLPTAFAADQLQAESTAAPGAVEAGGNSVYISARNLPPDQELALKLTFPAVVGESETPRYYAFSSRPANATPAPAEPVNCLSFDVVYDVFKTLLLVGTVVGGVASLFGLDKAKKRSQPQN